MFGINRLKAVIFDHEARLREQENQLDKNKHQLNRLLIETRGLKKGCKVKLDDEHVDCKIIIKAWGGAIDNGPWTYCGEDDGCRMVFGDDRVELWPGEETATVISEDLRIFTFPIRFFIKAQ